MRRRTLLVTSLFAPSVLASAGPALAQKSAVQGAGTSFLRNFYMRWGQGAAAATGIELAYEAASSDAGIAKATDRSVDFGACETPLSPGRLRERTLVQFPSVFGAMVVIVNLPEVQQDQLRLTPDA